MSVSTFSSFDGTELHYTDSGDPAAPVVLLLHGFAADITANWERPGVLEALVADGYRVIALDARGHGASQKPQEPAAYADEAMVRDAQSLLDFLDVARCDVVGYSMGSMSASRLASRDPRVQRLVLGGVGKRARYAIPLASEAAIADALEAPDADQVPMAAGGAVRAFADATQADKAALAALQRGHPFHDPDLAAITAPTLVLVGADDDLADEAWKLTDAISNAPTTLTTVPGDHLTAVADPEFIAVLRAFLAG